MTGSMAAPSRMEQSVEVTTRQAVATRPIRAFGSRGFGRGCLALCHRAQVSARPLRLLDCLCDRASRQRQPESTPAARIRERRASRRTRLHCLVMWAVPLSVIGLASGGSSGAGRQRGGYSFAARSPGQTNSTGGMLVGGSTASSIRPSASVVSK